MNWTRAEIDSDLRGTFHLWWDTMRANKFNARRTVLDGVSFASAAESRKYAELKLLERAGIIRGLDLQPEFPVIINGKVVFKYRADFAFFEGEKRRVLDVKGFMTPMFRLKRKCVEALYNVEIEVCR